MTSSSFTLQVNLDEGGRPRRPASELAPATVTRMVRGFRPAD